MSGFDSLLRKDWEPLIYSHWCCLPI